MMVLLPYSSGLILCGCFERTQTLIPKCLARIAMIALLVAFCCVSYYRPYHDLPAAAAPLFP